MIGRVIRVSGVGACVPVMGDQNFDWNERLDGAARLGLGCRGCDVAVIGFYDELKILMTAGGIG